MNSTSRIVPAILTDDPDALKSMIRLTETFTDYIQIDIMDGRYVPSTSITAEHLMKLSIKTDWEAHLMVDNPENYLEDYRKAGAKRVVFHYEATGKLLKVIGLAEKLGLPFGLAINPDTPIKAVLPFCDNLDCLLFLSVNPGFYGSPFIPDVLNKIKQFRSLCPNMETGIDGGIKDGNITRVAQTGVDYICVGSAIFMQPDPAASYHHLCELAAEASAPL